jgi:hypothetical protein
MMDSNSLRYCVDCDEMRSIREFPGPRAIRCRDCQLRREVAAQDRRERLERLARDG